MLRWFLAAFSLFALSFGALSAYWHWGAAKLPNLLRDAGFEASEIEVLGHPLQWRVEFRPATVFSRGGARLTIADATLEVPLTDRERPIFSAAGAFEIVVPGLGIVSGTAGHVGGKIQLERGWPRRFSLALVDIRCALCLPALGPRLERIEIIGSMSGLPALRPGAEGLEAWRSGGGRIEIGHGALRWGPLDIWGSASLALDERMEFAGKMVGEFAGIAEAAEAMAKAGEISIGEAASATLGIALSTKIGDPDDGVVRRGEVDIAWREGRLWFGQFPALRIPWRGGLQAP